MEHLSHLDDMQNLPSIIQIYGALNFMSMDSD